MGLTATTLLEAEDDDGGGIAQMVAGVATDVATAGVTTDASTSQFVFMGLCGYPVVANPG